MNVSTKKMRKKLAPGSFVKLHLPGLENNTEIVSKKKI